MGSPVVGMGSAVVKDGFNCRYNGFNYSVRIGSAKVSKSLAGIRMGQLELGCGSAGVRMVLAGI